VATQANKESVQFNTTQSTSQQKVCPEQKDDDHIVEQRMTVRQVLFNRAAFFLILKKAPTW
jgi:hypothetical protein